MEKILVTAMMSETRSGALLLHPSGDVMGNLLWPGHLTSDQLEALPPALAAIKEKSYFASPFPEGDGVTFSPLGETPYDAEAGLKDFREAFAFLDINELAPGERQSDALARLAADQKIMCTYLVPVEGLHLEAPLKLGETLFHAPVDGEDNLLSAHAWNSLCDFPGADADPTWAPDAEYTGTTEFLAHPLIERKIEIPLSLLYAARASVDGQIPLLRLVMEDADHALDPIRFTLCQYRRLEYLPAKPGWIGEFALAYVMPEGRAIEPMLLCAKPYVLRVSNNWLGLEVDSGGALASEMLADLIVDNKTGDEITLALKGALRALNRAFYLVDLEASFLHLVYAIDALCEPGSLRGEGHRLWITAFASSGDAAKFAGSIAAYNQRYRVRNSIVHHGETFASLGVKGEEECDFMLRILASCIETIALNGFETRRAAMDFAFDVLTSAEIAAHVAELNLTQIKLPLTADGAFKKHMQM